MSSVSANPKENSSVIPDCAAFVSRLREMRLPRYESLPHSRAREAMAAVRRSAAIEPPPIGLARDLEIPTIAGSVSARLYHPVKAGGVLPILCNHGVVPRSLLVKSG
jgi:hypothetical protein